MPYFYVPFTAITTMDIFWGQPLGSTPSQINALLGWFRRVMGNTLVWSSEEASSNLVDPVRLTSPSFAWWLCWLN